MSLSELTLKLVGAVMPGNTSLTNFTDFACSHDDLEALVKAAYQAGWNDREDDLIAGVNRIASAEGAQTRTDVEPVAWRVDFQDESACLVFTRDDADEVIADALPGATMSPLYAAPPTDAPGMSREAVAVLENIAAVPSTREDLNYLYVNVLHARGSLSKEVRREAVVAIKTYRDILEAVRSLALASLGGRVGEDGSSRSPPVVDAVPLPAPSPTPLTTMLGEAVRFASWAAGEGICPVVGQPARSPEDFLFEYSEATGEEDWETLGQRIPEILALSGRPLGAEDGQLRDDPLSSPSPVRGAGEEEQPFTREEFTEWYEWARMWSGSAFIGGETVSFEAANDAKSQLYSDLCRLGNHFSAWADHAPARLETPAHD